ncbi:hypothetical protein PHYPO_G00167720 [Pangasianodon hypophthalmus]|uniref:Uncharacterized protein n=1 Tax=Pangasianodon hypophthalmus TaxID=310915 RepID=A0A5N5JJ33_PANHP|nr:uncharacterized protein si:dkey-256e7.8 isoform X1 [Pangasianodon hypophthalmus]KAB5518586.1 hypothetical protein PHYPO_G00167720 [Pangasianodon hypophthalmus]
MDKASPQKASGGDVLHQKSQTIAELEKLVNRLQNALVSLEEENLNSNKKLKAIQGQYYDLIAKCNEDETYLDNCGELEKEKPEVVKDQEVEERKSKEFNMREYEDIRKCNESLDWRNRHLVKEDNILKHDHLEKQQLVDEVVLLQEELTHLKEEHRKAKLMQTDDQKPFSDSTLEDTSPDIAVWLQKENRALRERLEKSYLVSIKALRRVENLKEQQAELERCLFTLQTEKFLLQDEVRKLHREYLHLSKSVKLQLREGTTSLPAERDVFSLTKNPGGSTHHSPPQRAGTFGAADDRAEKDSV